jgi:hypothetical protein
MYSWFVGSDQGVKFSKAEERMDISRRRLLGVATTAATTTMLGQSLGFAKADSAFVCPDPSLSSEWHPLTQSLLDRACKINRPSQRTGRLQIERTIRQIADASGSTKPLVIKWMDTPRDAHDHLSRLGLDALLDMGTTRFWRQFQPPVSPDEETFERAFEARMLANELLGVGEQDRLLMAPKLRARSQATLASRSDEEVFRVRAVSSQIGWLETSLADAAAQAVSDVELLLSAGASEGSAAIDHQLKVFETYERGLLATWETQTP